MTAGTQSALVNKERLGETRSWLSRAGSWCAACAARRAATHVARLPDGGGRRRRGLPAARALRVRRRQCRQRPGLLPRQRRHLPRPRSPRPGPSRPGVGAARARSVPSRPGPAQNKARPTARARPGPGSATRQLPPPCSAAAAPRMRARPGALAIQWRSTGAGGGGPFLVACVVESLSQTVQRFLELEYAAPIRRGLGRPANQSGHRPAGTAAPGPCTAHSPHKLAAMEKAKVRSCSYSKGVHIHCTVRIRVRRVHCTLGRQPARQPRAGIRRGRIESRPVQQNMAAAALGRWAP